MITKSFHTLRNLAVLLMLLACVTSLAGCGGGGGGGGQGSVGSISTAPTVTLPTAPAPSTPASTASALNVGQLPTYPTSPPPKIGGTAKPKSASATGTSIVLYPGWNEISFPFAQLQSASGFTYQLYTYAQGAFIAVDPVNNPAAVDTRFGYLAYTLYGETVTVSGTDNTGQVNAVPLVQGWNLLGCPSATSLPYASMSASRLGVTRVLDEVASLGLTPSATWLLQYTYGWLQGMMLFENILESGATLPTTRGRWLFVWQDTTLNLNVAPPVSRPTITSLSTSSVTADQALTINGSGFATADVGAVTIGGILVPPSSITGWTDTTITLTVPPGAASGFVVVFVNGFPSNRVSVTAGGSGPVNGTASLTGLVQDASSGAALSGAQVLLDSGQTAVTDAGGAFSIDNIPAGDHFVMVSRLGYNVGSGTFTFVANTPKSVLVTLTALSTGGGGGGGGTGGGGGASTGTLYVNAYPYTYGGDRYYVSNITVSEYNNYARRWSQSWYQDLGESYWSLTCSSATVGAWYVVRITYKNAAGSTLTGSWDVKLNSSSQTVTRYGPYSKMQEVPATR